MLLSSLTLAAVSPLLATNFESLRGARVGIRRTPSLGEVLRLCSVLELFCLYDHVHLWYPQYNQEEPTFPPVLPPMEELKQLSAALLLPTLGKALLRKVGQTISIIAHGSHQALVEGSPLFTLAKREGVLHVITGSDFQIRINEATQEGRLQFLEHMRRASENIRATERGRFRQLGQLEALRNLTLSRLFRYSYAPDEAENLDIQNSKWMTRSRLFGDQLWLAYQKLSGSLREEIRELVKIGRQPEIFIPPISTLILSKASTARDIPEITFEIRKKFTRVREAFREYESTIRDPDASLAQLMQAKNRLEEITTTLTKKYSARETLGICEWRDTLDLFQPDGEFDEFQVSEFLLGKPPKMIEDWIRNRDIMYLLKVRKHFIEIRGRAGLVKKVFGVEVTPQELAALDPGKACAD